MIRIDFTVDEIETHQLFFLFDPVHKLLHNLYGCLFQRIFPPLFLPPCGGISQHTAIRMFLDA